jgi:hypothetical protein
MYLVRTFRASAAVLAATLTVAALGTGAAQAGKPTKPGGVTGLTAQVSPHPSDTYDVTATWNAVANATGYKATVTTGGSVLSSATLTTPAWSPTLHTTPGSATLSVRAVVGHRTGKPSSVPLQLLDVTKPTGTFAAASDNTTGGAIITQDSLNDDSGAANVTRTVDWGDGSAPEAWTTGTPINHHYTLTPAQEVRFPATVTLQDAAHNTATIAVVPAPVFNDHTKPTGAFTTAPGSAWATVTAVTMTQTSLTDDRSPSADITRTVDWGDGSTPGTWTSGTTFSHVYATAGTFTPRVTATDEAGNEAVIDSSAVTVKRDSVAPRVRIAVAKPRHSVKAWKALHGRATDAGTGVKAVTLKAVEKRGKVWYGYNASTKTWVKAATKARAFARSRAFTLKTNSRHRWSARLVGLTKGTLMCRARATDLVGNRSAPVSRKASLTRR